MIITFLRSSSYSAFSFCQQQYWIAWTLGIRDPGNFRAEKGTCTHKMLELLAQKKLATQLGEPTFFDQELGRTFDSASFNPEEAAEAALEHYIAKSIHTYKKADLRDCKDWMYEVLNYNDGMFSPLKRTVITPEQHFDFTIEEPWAHFSQKDPHTGEKLEGQLSLKGTMDLLVAVDGHPDTVELIDYKTGARKDWGTGEEKTWKKLRDDPQLRLYHYALTRLYPDIKHIIVTIFYTRDGGPFSLDFSRKDIPRTLQLIRNQFEAIRDCTRPKLHKFWGCSKFCWYGKNTYPGTNKTYCDHLHQELLTLGMERCTRKYGSPNATSRYGGGGGISDRDSKETK